MEEQNKPQSDARQNDKLSAGDKPAPGQEKAAAPGKLAEKSTASKNAAPPPPPREVQKKPAEEPRKPAHRRRTPILLAGVALFVALAALGGAGWLYQQNNELAARVGDVDRGAQSRYEQLGSHEAIKGLDERTRLLAERVAARFAKIDESLQRADEALRNAAQEQIRDERGWRLAEIDYVLRIGAHRLLLLQDIDGAIAALQTADRQLHQLGSPVFIPLRERLDADMRALRSVQRPDIPGVSIKIDGLMDVVYELPPRTVTGDFQTAAAEVDAPLDGVWEFVSRFVTVKHNQEPVRTPPVNYAPENHARTLVATLRAAQTAALRADSGEYVRLMAVAAATLREHFDPQSHLVTDTLREVETLAGASLTAELPDITGSFELLDELRAGSDETEVAAP
ncbi:MAG: uroporphyrinogen-III C-methyltransferase [Gammaproteobacteria bacterium]|nr:uroporphyrinogen-III C-methyltransferase [Gammaproteobacteria bacterium]